MVYGINTKRLVQFALNLVVSSSTVTLHPSKHNTITLLNFKTKVGRQSEMKKKTKNL